MGQLVGDHFFCAGATSIGVLKGQTIGEDRDRAVLHAAVHESPDEHLAVDLEGVRLTEELLEEGHLWLGLVEPAADLDLGEGLWPDIA